MENEEFKKKLNPEQYRIMRGDGVEAEYTGKYWDSKKDGTYACAACATPLFSSKEKFDSKTGWASFHKPLDDTRLEYKKEADKQGKIGIRCKKCHSNVGFLIGGRKPYYRAYSVSLDLREDGARLAMLRETKSTLEDVKAVVDQVQQPGSQTTADNSGWDSVLSSVSGVAGMLGGGAVGIVVGAIAAYVYCHATCMGPLTAVHVATSTEATSTPAEPISPETHTPTPPRETPAASTLSPAETNTTSTSASSSTDGTPANGAATTQ